ncbi:MAG: hypothetical protein ACRCSG_02840 [Cellulosilyticaceae bacterium]
MAGYNGYSMSNNAVDAYATGEKPNSKWTKTDLLEAYENECVDLGIEVLDLKKLTVSNLRFLLLRCSSWHHTSSRFNKTNFYSISTNAVETLTQATITEMIEQNKANRLTAKAKKDIPSIEKWEVKFLVWGGSRKHPKAVEHKEVVERDYSKGYVLTTEGRKMTSSNGFEFIRKVA